MEKIYWNEQGKYQSEYDELDKIIVSFGKTDNKYVNILLVVLNIYYDVYNNNSFNLENYINDIEKYLVHFNDLYRCDFKCNKESLLRKLKNKKTLESIMDRTIEILRDKDLSFTEYVIYQDFFNGKLSYEKKEGFTKVTFGEKERWENWINSRVNDWNFKIV